MSEEKDDFYKKLLEVFKVESQENISSILMGLIELEKKQFGPEFDEIIERIHRDAHSLKGASRAVNLNEIEDVCKKIEYFFSSWKKNKREISKSEFNELHGFADKINTLLLDEKTEVNLKDERKNEVQSSAEIDSVRVSVSKLSELLRKSEELITAKLFFRQRAEDVEIILNSFLSFKKEFEVFFSNTKKNVFNMPFPKSYKLSSDFEFFYSASENELKKLVNQLGELASLMAQDHHGFSIMVDDLIFEGKQLMMLPFSTITPGFYKMVRDLSSSQDKDIEFLVQGDHIEIDKRILEEIKIPLMHIVRNSIDHGIETDLERKNQNKAERSRISINISHLNANQIEIIIADNGSGINLEKIKELALKDGLISEQEKDSFSKENTIDLIFKSGFSTKPNQSDISGQGLGMPIVKEKVEKLRGDLFVNTEDKKGTSVRIILPVTFSSFKGILCKIKKDLFIIPTVNVERVMRVSSDQTRTAGNQVTINLDGKVILLVSLRDILNLTEESTEKIDFLSILIVKVSDQTIGIIADDLVGEVEVLVKRLTGAESSGHIITAAAILGAGQVVPVLNINELSSILKNESNNFSLRVEGEWLDEKENKTILLVDDSITTRSLLKNILETSGFSVLTAVDGLDAWSKIKSNHFSLIVTDVEMPNMDGFELIHRIKSDKKVENIPIVIVSTRDSQEDRLRGMDLGADAYIIKKGLNDSELVRIVHELI